MRKIILFISGQSQAAHLKENYATKLRCAACILAYRSCPLDI